VKVDLSKIKDIIHLAEDGYDNFLDVIGHVGIPMGYMRFVR